MEKKVAIITGANSGVGLSVADRLLMAHEGIRVCLACRNKGRAENARARLLQRHSSANISIIIVDTSSVSLLSGLLRKSGKNIVRELEDYLGGTQTTQIIWTSSQNANADDFSYTNIQHRNGKEPYASSKYATDVVSVALNDRLNKKGVYSVSTCPGLVMSNMTFGILPSWFWFLVMPFLFFMRLFVTSLTCNAYNAAEALIWISKQRCESLNSRIKYCSHCSIFGKPYVAEEKLNISEKDADNLYNQMEGLYQGFKSKYRNGTSRTAKDSVSNGLQNGMQNGFH
ncbi:3-keto-steroid reductase/17-beta-hydroxysteroid dehydrogenase 7-like [Mercenaria mercenaria]|uniref:3-keto-steroid reductase/17-beta-hydroxysteroid dehydrogenase 7-like n=1 Tax=Mercenaria mercenaria TaxID=6596 RepID=UPI00234F4C74|nr:3-keto-steroid reductase/17-beta-hydroxysteroid dehydrogenase 7-like [Mercenaria mercenaria]